MRLENGCNCSGNVWILFGKTLMSVLFFRILRKASKECGNGVFLSFPRTAYFFRGRNLISIYNRLVVDHMCGLKVLATANRDKKSKLTKLH